MLEKIEVYASINNNGDGSASIVWFLSQEKADKLQKDPENWAEDCTEKVETFVGSNIHKEAVENEENYEFYNDDYYDE